MPTTMSRWCIATFLALAAIAACDAAVHPYAGEYFEPHADAYVFRAGREGLFAQVDEGHETDAWNTAAPGVSNGESYVRFDRVRFHRPASVASRFDAGGAETGLVEAVLFELNDHDRVGFVDPAGYTRYCCAEDLVESTGCVPGRVIVNPRDDDPESPWVKAVPFSGDDVDARVYDQTVRIRKTGMYYLWFISCDPELGPSLSVRGATTWKNPSGYLPGMVRFMLPFYGFLSLAYLALGAAWVVASAARWQTLMPLQYCVALVVALGMAESSAWYFDYVNFNATGYRPYAATVFAVLLGSARKALSRSLVLVVAMGYGVVRPTLGGVTRDVVGLSLAYFVAAAALDLEANLGKVDDLTSTARLVLVAPVAFLDATYILWIFTALSRTLAQTQARRQEVKFELYRRFTNALAVSVVASVGWIFYEMWFKVTDMINEKWEGDWVTRAFWEALSFGITAAICWLWRPSEDGMRYAYSKANATDDWDDDGAALGGAGVQLTKLGKATMGATPGKSVAVGQTPMKTEAFPTLDDDEEEDLEAKLE